MAEKVMEIPRSQLRHIQDGYCCAGCWNPVSVRFTSDMTGEECIVNCGTPDCNLPGFVTARYVERRLAIDHSEALEARMVLSKSAECGWLVTGKKTVPEYLTELGF